ncbi:hypothetical protein OV079_38800 [Nannocystis pusilla]|uniref:Uncharacterized protein n=1 Tax=Nannocystis pusilla TaxID=889268 RepID=A0A9X3J199_9BACT|nr:hypothetical protein [Nannocystis pusilla]MCY1011411.1 hypothetical protein [Nannocystis pusilla]
MQDSARSHRDLVMGALAGQAALAARSAARALYEAGGRDVLPTVAQAGLQTVLTRTATGTVAAAAPTLLVEAAVQAGAAEVTSLAVVTTARAAGPRSRAPPPARAWSASSSTPPSARPRA